MPPSKEMGLILRNSCMSVDEFCRRTSEDRRYIHEVQCGREFLGVDKMQIWARMLGYTVDELLKNDGQPSLSQDLAIFGRNTSMRLIGTP